MGRGVAQLTITIPTDFARFAGIENDRQLEDRYGFAIKVIQRMRRETGIKSPACRQHRDLPEDFSDHAHCSNLALARRYGVGEKVIRRFRREYGELTKDT